MLAGAPALAENPKADMNTFSPSLHPGDVLGIQTATQPKHLEWTAGAWLWANGKPWSLTDLQTGQGFQVVSYQVLGEVYGSLGLGDFFDLALGIPMVFVSAGDAPTPVYVSRGLEQASGFSLGDIRLAMKATFLGGNGRGLGVALGADLTFPTSTKRNYSGDSNVTGTPRIIVDWSGDGWVVAANVGIKGRREETGGGFSFGSELQMGLGAQFPLICGMLEGLFTLEHRTSLLQPYKYDDEAALDLMGGLRGNIGNLTISGAAGAGVLTGYGSPAWRAAVNVGYAPEVAKGCVYDRDGDDIVDAEDACPDEPGPPAAGGCPDRDGDRILDKDDACPDEAGLVAFAGCPDWDKDGIPDREDKCPTDPGPKETKGCPEKDRDKDGIMDKDDACPDQWGPEVTRGCPDRDKDGVADMNDKCPDVYGKAELQGCPPPTPKTVRLTAEKIEILKVVLFETGKAKIRPESFGLLNDVATVLKDNPHLKKVQVEGHTDNVGKPDKNVTLSQARAESVRAYLVEKGGVDGGRLVAKGFGDTQPIDDNSTPTGRAANRRVAFTILEQ
jgi:outer membrane protein OmpA-like peptidoglycan-associated protein